MTWLCPCITFGQIAEIIDRGSSSCGTSGALYALVMLLTGCNCVYSCFYRAKMRSQYGLQEKPCADCPVHFFCEPCALSQEYRELKKRGFDMNLGKTTTIFLMEFTSTAIYGWLIVTTTILLVLCRMAREHGEAGSQAGDDHAAAHVPRDDTLIDRVISGFSARDGQGKAGQGRAACYICLTYDYTSQIFLAGL